MMKDETKAAWGCTILLAAALAVMVSVVIALAFLARWVLHG